jgi:D-alanyl-D-alanine carboxypeptidase
MPHAAAQQGQGRCVRRAGGDHVSQPAHLAAPTKPPRPGSLPLHRSFVLGSGDDGPLPLGRAGGQHHSVRPTHLCAALAVAAVLTLAACSGATDQAASPGPDIQSRLDARRESYGAPGGLVLLARGDGRWFAASGTADTAGTPITETTRFRIASITKPIVASLVLDSAERGEVGLDEVVGDLVPGVVRAAPPITVRQLLDHTSGIVDITSELTTTEALQADIERLPDEQIRAEAQAALDGSLAGQQVIAPARVLVALSELHDRYFPPGSGYHYSNTGYQLAGMVLEEVTGRPLSELLDERVAKPLGLQRTTLAPPDTAAPELRGYGTSTVDGSLVDVTDDLSLFGNGANGGVISTADELLTTLQAIVGGHMLPADLTAQMEEPNRESYGLGLATYTLSCGTFLGHEGGVNGTASIALVSPDASDGVVIALNLRSGEDPRLPDLADQMLCGSP